MRNGRPQDTNSDLKSMQRPQTFAHVYTMFGLELSSPVCEVMVWSLSPVVKKEQSSQGISWYNRRGQLHRERDLPARDDCLWLLNGKPCREFDKPTCELRSFQCWEDNTGRYHRAIGPAKLWISLDGTPTWAEWWIRGQLKRDGHPQDPK